MVAGTPIRILSLHFSRAFKQALGVSRQTTSQSEEFAFGNYVDTKQPYIESNLLVH
jgi:hypothetical protein